MVPLQPSRSPATASPTLVHLRPGTSFADGGYAGDKLEIALRNMKGPTIGIVRRPDNAEGFVVIARRWNSWSGLSRGSTGAEGWQRIGKHQSPHPTQGC